MIGKWHLVTNPAGFDYWKIRPGQGVYHDPVLIDMDGTCKKLTVTPPTSSPTSAWNG